MLYGTANMSPKIKSLCFDIEPLLITICPLDQWDRDELQQYGYYHETSLLSGVNSLDRSVVAWGAQYNLTFEELVYRVLKYNLNKHDLKAMQNKKGVINYAEYEIRFYPMHGYCYDLVNISTSGELIIHTRYQSTCNT